MPARRRRNQERRRRQHASVERAYEQLKDCLDGEFGQGYFNSHRALAAERAGLNICDAVLGHVLASSPDENADARAVELLNRVSDALVDSEVENRCHNLHAACGLMLDALQVPAVVVWGSVYATDEEGRAFWLNACTPPAFPGHRPGHSWLLTSSWRVVDLSLKHQYAVSGDYDAIRATLPSLITATSSESSEPDVSWWRFEGGYRLAADIYDNETRYQDVTGWSQYSVGGTSVRYLPGAPTLPEEADFADVNIRIGGLSPREFFEQNASDLVPS